MLPSHIHAMGTDAPTSQMLAFAPFAIVSLDALSVFGTENMTSVFPKNKPIVSHKIFIAYMCLI